MKKEDVRGLSTVIATLLIILLVIIAVTIVWGVVRSIIKNNSESVSLGKFTVDLEIVPPIKQNSTSVIIKVKRNAGEGELEGIIFSIFDGERSHLFERDTNLNPLEMGTFVLPYNGTIVSISISPTFLTESGKKTIGSISDTYHGTILKEYAAKNCTPNCQNKDCGDDGCFGSSCGDCGADEECVLQKCVVTPDPCIPDICSESICAADTCEGESCSDGCKGSCGGTKEIDCKDEFGNTIWCGPPDGECGDPLIGCGICQDQSVWCDDGMCCPIGSHKSLGGGSCETDCNATLNCQGKNCGADGCGGSCGNCALPPFNSSYNCNLSGLCEMCVSNCGARLCGDSPNGCGICGFGDCKSDPFNSSYNCNMTSWECEMCTPNCNGGAIECGNSTNDCGICGECTGQDTCIDGICVTPEQNISGGRIYSVWPLAKTYFDSASLPNRTGLPGEDYSNFNYVKFPGSAEELCLQIWYFTPGIISYSYGEIQMIAFSTEIEVGDIYQVWETYDGCTGET